jgi:hypothetical protein
MQPTPLQPPSPLNYDDDRPASARDVRKKRRSPFFKRRRKFWGSNAPWRNRFSGGRATLFAVRSRRCGQRCCSGVHRSHCLPTPRDTPSAPLLGSGTPRSGVPHMAYGLARRGRLDAAPLNRPRASHGAQPGRADRAAMSTSPVNFGLGAPCELPLKHS